MGKLLAVFRAPSPEQDLEAGFLVNGLLFKDGQFILLISVLRGVFGFFFFLNQLPILALLYVPEIGL